MPSPMIIVGQLFYFPPLPFLLSNNLPLLLFLFPAGGQRSNFIFSTQPPSVARDRHFDIITTFQRKNFRSLPPSLFPCSFLLASSINCLEGEGGGEGFEYRLNNVHVSRIVIHRDLLRMLGLVSSIFDREEEVFNKR